MFKGILKEQTIQVGIGFVFIVVLLGTFILPEWMSNNFMYGLSRGLAVLGLMILWRTNLVSLDTLYIMDLVHTLLQWHKNI